MPKKKKTAVVTGGNRGIGFEICRQLASEGVCVVLTARNKETGEAAHLELKKQGLDVQRLQLDITDDESIRNFARELESKFGGLDILVNNAGIFIDWQILAIEVDTATVQETIETNLYGPLRMCQAMIPLMKKRGGGRIVNVSSQWGAMSHIEGGQPAYRISKVALNALTLMLADELRDANIQVNAMHPGWVRTQMGGNRAPVSPEEGAETAVWLALQPENGPTGKFFLERKEIPW